MYIQDVALPSSSNKNKKKTNPPQDYSRQSLKSSHSEDRQGWSENDTRQATDISGKLAYLYYCYRHSVLVIFTLLLIELSIIYTCTETFNFIQSNMMHN